MVSLSTPMDRSTSINLARRTVIFIRPTSGFAQFEKCREELATITAYSQCDPRGNFGVFEDTESSCGRRIHRDKCRQSGIENLLRTVQLVIRNASVSKCFFKIVCGWKVPDSASGAFYADTEGANYTEACKIALRLRDVQEQIGHSALVLARLLPIPQDAQTIPGPQRRGTGDTLGVVWRGRQDRAHPPLHAPRSGTHRRAPCQPAGGIPTVEHGFHASNASHLNLTSFVASFRSALRKDLHGSSPLRIPFPPNPPFAT
jgi:hypothetical protein